MLTERRARQSQPARSSRCHFSVAIEKGTTEAVPSEDGCYLLSSPLPLLHHAHKVMEEVMRIMGAGRRLGVILHAESRKAAGARPSHLVAIQIDVVFDDLGFF